MAYDNPSIIIGNRAEAANTGKAARANPNKPISQFGTTVDVSILDNLPTTEQVRAAIRRAMQRAVEATVRAMQATVPRRTGRTAATIRGTGAQAGAGLTTIGVVSVDPRWAHVARFLEFGTAPHEIRARGARRRRRRGAGGSRVLAFQGIGGRQFAARVRHPGIRARHWIQQAGMTATPSIVAAFQDAFRDVT